MARKKSSRPTNFKDARAQNSTNGDARPRRKAREHLKTAVLEELWSIWRADQRVPSIKSRRLWAISRDAKPHLVDSWFTRRRTHAKKAGHPISHDSYDLPLDPSVARTIKPELESIPDLSSDDTLLYPPDGDELDVVEASSDTVLDEDALVEPKGTESPAYTAVVQQPHHEYPRFQPKPRFDACLPDDSLGITIGSANLYARCDDYSKGMISCLPVCNQGRGTFRCMLCSANSDQDKILPDSETTSRSTGYFSLSHPRLDFFCNALSELSAIPFLFRTPHTVLPNNAADGLGLYDWTIVENELASLVNDRKLDFSFLDSPHLASMGLVD